VQLAAAVAATVVAAERAFTAPAAMAKTQRQQEQLHGQSRLGKGHVLLTFWEQSVGVHGTIMDIIERWRAACENNDRWRHQRGL